MPSPEVLTCIPFLLQVAQDCQVFPDLLSSLVHRDSHVLQACLVRQGHLCLLGVQGVPGGTFDTEDLVGRCIFLFLPCRL